MKKIQIAKPHIDRTDIQAVVNVMKSGTLSLGPKHLEFEQNFAKYLTTKFACSVANGTCGLHLVVKAMDLKPGDEVITTPFSFIASANCLLFEDVKPVFVDIEEETFNLDPNKIEAAITPRTKAILVVHIFGQTADMAPIMKIAKKHNLRVFEDACESLGATYNGKMAGTFGEAAVFAFYPNKQITTGEGGMIVSNRKSLIQMCASLRNQGRNLKNDWLIHDRMGYNYRLDEMSAALGVTQLKKLDKLIDQHRQIVKWYEAELKSESSIILPNVGRNRTHSWFVYVIRVLSPLRDKVMSKLAKIGIQTKPYLPVIHLQPYMVEKFGFKPGDFPVAETVASQTLALPFYPGLSRADVKYVAAQLKKILNHDK